MTDDDIRQEMRTFQAATWREGNLLDHVKEHRRHYESAWGMTLGPQHVRESSATILQDPERVFTGYTKEGLSYAFTGWSPKGVIVIVVSRAGRIRTMFPAKRFDLWLGRRVNYVEVTDRVR